MTKIIELKNIVKNYQTKNEKLEVLKGINYSFEKGKLYAIKGHSGSGKTTLIKILGLMDQATKGEYLLFENRVDNLNDTEASNYRLKHIGFIFQDYNLNPYLKADENIIVPMIVNKEIEKKSRNNIADSLLEKVGLIERKNHFPKELSGGEQQRIAIARALANNPSIIIADEPTGNLDPNTSLEIMNVLEEINKLGTTIIMVTHDINIVKRMNKRVIVLDSGRVLKDYKKGTYQNENI